MIAAAHQPHYMPWMGYFHKMALVDHFVLMDNMEFTRSNWINRNRILQQQQIHWLTLPVMYRGCSRNAIRDIRLDQSKIERNLVKQLKSIYYNYKNRPGFEDFYALLEAILKKRYVWLLDIDLDILQLIAGYLGIKNNLILASEKGIAGKKEDELFFSVMEKTGSDTIAFGMGASRQYVNMQAIISRGYKILLQDFIHPVYPQFGSSFVPGISIVDMLMNLKKEEAVKLFRSTLP